MADEDPGNPFFLLEFARHLGMVVSIDQNYNELVGSCQRRCGVSRGEAEKMVADFITEITDQYFEQLWGKRR